jgi:hypothetical protein
MTKKQNKSIQDDVKKQAKEIIEEFNQTVCSKQKCVYTVRFKGKFLYLDRNGEPTARLTYNGGINSWSFAIYKWSNNAYDSEERFFPGSQYVDGTIKGAMKAGLGAYS